MYSASACSSIISWSTTGGIASNSSKLPLLDTACSAGAAPASAPTLSVFAGMVVTCGLSVSMFHQGMAISGISSFPSTVGTIVIVSTRVPTIAPLTNVRSISAGSGYVLAPLRSAAPNGGSIAPSSPSATMVMVRTTESPIWSSLVSGAQLSSRVRPDTGSQKGLLAAAAGRCLTSTVMPSIKAVTRLVLRFLKTKLLEPSVTSPRKRMSGISRGPLLCGKMT